MPIIKLLVEGGDMKPGPAVGQQLGPLGVNIGQVVSKVNEATSDFKGMKVPVILDVDTDTKDINVEVSSPPTSELLKKEFNIEKAADDKKNQVVANAAIEQIIKVAKTKHPDALSKDFKATVKSVIGTCGSMGVYVESKIAIDAQEDIDEGKYDSEINEQKTEPSAEKIAELEEFFKDISAKQEAAKKAEEAAKAEAEAKATESAAGQEKPAEGEAKAATEKPVAKEPETKA